MVRYGKIGGWVENRLFFFLRILLEDAAEQKRFVWRYDGKLDSVIDLTGGQHLAFHYDATGQRIGKDVIDPTNAVNNRSIYYLRDAQGNVLSTYGKTYSSPQSFILARLSQKESFLYGSRRLGDAFLERTVWADDLIAEYDLNTGQTTYQKVRFLYPLLPVDVDLCRRRVGFNRYELTDHLGNVRATVSGGHWSFYQARPLPVVVDRIMSVKHLYQPTLADCPSQ